MMHYDEIFDETVPQRAVMVTRTTRYILPVAEGATLDDIAAVSLGGDDFAKLDSYTDTVSVSEADADDVVLAADGFMFPPRPLLEVAGRFAPDGDDDVRHRISDAAEEIRVRRGTGI